MTRLTEVELDMRIEDLRYNAIKWGADMAKGMTEAYTEAQRDTFEAERALKAYLDAEINTRERYISLLRTSRDMVVTINTLLSILLVGVLVVFLLYVVLGY